jgi:DNA-directed RNA polymerase specialized sigma24 family protein
MARKGKSLEQLLRRMNDPPPPAAATRDTWARLAGGEELSDDDWADLLDSFTPKQREAIRLCYVEGLTHAAAAERLGVSRRAVSYRLAAVEAEAPDLVQQLLDFKQAFTKVNG